MCGIEGSGGLFLDVGRFAQVKDDGVGGHGCCGGCRFYRTVCRFYRTVCRYEAGVCRYEAGICFRITAVIGSFHGRGVIVLRPWCVCFTAVI